MARSKKIQRMIAELPHGDVEAVVFIKESPFDGYRYPAYRLRRRGVSKTTPQGDFFEYDSEDVIAAVRDAKAFIKRYQQNPTAAVEEAAKRQDSHNLAA